MTVRALVVCSFVLDLAFRVPRRPGPGEIVAAHAAGEYRGGKGYNQAVALARLGATVTIVGALGNDVHGDAFVAALQREGVDASRVVRLRGSRTAIAVPLITPDGEVSFVQYPGANRELAAAHCAELPDCDVLLLQGEVSPSTSLHAARIIRRRGGVVVLNPAPAGDISSELLDAATVVAPNALEARALAGAELEGVAAAEALRTDSLSAVVSLGAQGAVWADQDGSGTVAPPRVVAVDTTGAGDAFSAGLALALAEGAGTADAVVRVGERTLVVDYKTGSGSWPEAARQRSSHTASGIRSGAVGTPSSA
jgi:ribokinase